MSKIAEILRAYPADCQPTEVEFLGSAGGLSGAEFWRLVAPRGALGLRRWPMEHPTLERLAFIHSVLNFAADHGLHFLPVPIETIAGRRFVEHDGRLWELTPWLPGLADYERSPNLAKVCAGMIALAKFHLAVVDYPGATRFAPAPAIVQRLKRIRELQAGDISTLTDAINESTGPELATLARRFAAALPRVGPPAIAQLAPLADVPLPLQVCIRDVWCDNILFSSDTMTGLVDFGATDIDTPATDVARLLGSFAGGDRTLWHDGLTAYSSVRQLTHEEFCAVPALDAAGAILAGCNWIRWIYLEGREFDDPTKVTSRFRRILERIV